MCLDQIICEAMQCSAVLGAKYAHDYKFGEASEETKINFLKLNGFIRTLSRNHETIEYKKEINKVESVDFSSLVKQKSFLTLRHKEIVTCTKTKISPCLCDSEIRYIIEQVKLLCSTLNCNCK